MNIKFETNISDFVKTLNDKPTKVMAEVNADSDIYRKDVYDETYHRVPLDTGVLRHSLYSKVLTRSNSLYVQDFEYSATDPENGFNYAKYQHETTGLSHLKGGEAFYLKEGIKASERLVVKDIEKAVARALR